MKKLLHFLWIILLSACILAGCDDAQEPNTGVPGDTHTHAYGEWSVTTAATCSEKGEEKRTCACGESEARELAKLLHTYVDSPRGTKPYPPTTWLFANP